MVQNTEFDCTVKIIYENLYRREPSTPNLVEHHNQLSFGLILLLELLYIVFYLLKMI